MSRLTDLPSEDDVRSAAREVIEQARQTGHRPSVLAVARRFGLSNTTFRRNFPDIARELGEHRRTPPAGPEGAAEGSVEAARELTLVERNAKLVRDNKILHDHLELAIANIMRLTLDNQRLRQELEAATQVTNISTRRG